MNKTQSLFFALLILGSMSLYSCQAPTQEGETAEETDMTAENRDERVSPLRTVQGTVNGKEVSIQYGAPSVKNRTVWGDMVPYNFVWRTGANEATNVTFANDVTVQGRALPAGRYSLFTIPMPSGPWTVIFNSEWDLEHGHFQYKEVNDVLRVEVNPIKGQDHQEQLEFKVEDPGIVLRWEEMKLPIEVK